VVIAANFSNRSIESDYRIGLPRGGNWIIRLNSDWKGYSPDFDDVGNPEGQVEAKAEPYDGLRYSGVVSLPAYGFLILSQEESLPLPSDHPDDQKQDPQPEHPHAHPDH
jgi:1,4-alpha-glucan branching enzyme